MGQKHPFLTPQAFINTGDVSMATLAVCDVVTMRVWRHDAEQEANRALAVLNMIQAAGVFRFGADAWCEDDPALAEAEELANHEFN